MNFVDVGASAVGTKVLRLTSTDMQGEIDVPIAQNVASVDGPHKLGIRPDNIELVDKGEGHIAGQVTLVERLGTESQVHIILDNNQTFTVIARGTHPAAVGDRVYLKFPAQHCHVFDDDGQAYPRQLDAETRSLIDRQKSAA